MRADAGRMCLGLRLHLLRPFQRLLLPDNGRVLGVCAGQKFYVRVLSLPITPPIAWVVRARGDLMPSADSFTNFVMAPAAANRKPSPPQCSTLFSSGGHVYISNRELGCAQWTLQHERRPFRAPSGLRSLIYT